jgi:hypothetical protein
MSESDALKALGAFPIVQAAVAVIILFAGMFLMRRGERDPKSSRPAPDQTVPQWLMMGPAHDAISAIHDIAEQGRRQIEVQERCEAHLMNIKAVLEAIRNESRMR